MNQRNPFEPPQSPVGDLQPSDDGIAPVIQRPKAIDVAFWLIIGSAALGLLSFVVRGMHEPPFVVVVVMLVLIGFAALIRSGKNWARIVFAVFFVIGLSSYLFVRELVAQNGTFFFAVFVLQTVLQGYALWLTFRPPGKGWFKRARAS
jgi:hypothetical protein